MILLSKSFTLLSRTFVVLGTLLLIASCSFYQLGQKTSSKLEGVESIYVTTPVVSINPTITQAPIYFKNHLHTALMHKTPYRLTPQKSADATLIIQITDQNNRVIQRSDDNLLRGAAYKLRLRSQWKIVQDNKVLLSGTINEEALFVAQDQQETSSLTNLNRSSWILAHQEAVKQALESISNKVAAELIFDF